MVWQKRFHILGTLDSSDLLGMNEADPSQRGLYTTQPSWCSFEGVYCGNDATSLNYASVIMIDIMFLQLNGSLLSSIGNFRSVESLGLIGNRINGTIPNTTGFLSSLIDVHLTLNSLTGTIPSTISMMS